MDDEQGRPTKDRPDGVNKKRIPELNLDAKIPIYYKASAKSANTQLISAFPKEALTLFSKTALNFSRKAQDNDQKFDLYQIQGGDVPSLKLIFDWIKDCLEQQSITKFPDLPESEDDPFGPTLHVIQAANTLDIPAGSLQFFLEKRLDFIARKNLMPFDQVRDFYSLDSQLYQAGLQHVACTSIFNAWWDYRLDATVNPELMGELTDLRHEFPELDADLHQACENKEQEIAQRKLEKKLKREADLNAFSDAPGDQAFDNNTVVAAGDWNAPADQAITDAWTGDNNWNKENEAVECGTVESKDTNMGLSGKEDRVLDWADESAADYQQKSHQTQASTPMPKAW